MKLANFAMVLVEPIQLSGWVIAIYSRALHDRLIWKNSFEDIQGKEPRWDLQGCRVHTSIPQMGDTIDIDPASMKCTTTETVLHVSADTLAPYLVDALGPC